jgi:hypothetical protein
VKTVAFILDSIRGGRILPIRFPVITESVFTLIYMGEEVTDAGAGGSGVVRTAGVALPDTVVGEHADRFSE